MEYGNFLTKLQEEKENVDTEGWKKIGLVKNGIIWEMREGRRG